MLIIEHDRRPSPGTPASPVIVYVPATPRPDAASGRVAPELIAEVIDPSSADEREGRYARAGVREFWRVEPVAGQPPRVHVLTDPDGAAGRFRGVVTHVGDDPVRSGVLPRLVLRPKDLAV